MPSVYSSQPPAVYRQVWFSFLCSGGNGSLTWELSVFVSSFLIHSCSPKFCRPAVQSTTDVMALMPQPRPLLTISLTYFIFKWLPYMEPQNAPGAATIREPFLNIHIVFLPLPSNSPDWLTIPPSELAYPQHTQYPPLTLHVIQYLCLFSTELWFP